MPEVRVACARPDEIDGNAWHGIAAVLDAHEQQRASDFRFEADRRAYVLSHAMRRALVARELNVAPQELHFGHDTEGRPFLEQPGADRIFFSHSRRRQGVACAVTRMGPVGIDVEVIDEDKADAQLLHRFVNAPAPRANVPATRAFFLYWTALEAFWKAQGSGLSDRNARIRVEPHLGEWRSVHFESSPQASAGDVMALDVLDGCALAIALLQRRGPPRLLLERYSSGMEIKQLFKDNSAQ